MKKIFLLYLALLTLALHTHAQPYGGTIFVDPDIITASDSSTLSSVTYVGQGAKTVFDRRVNNWIVVQAWLFAVVWNDGLSTTAVVNPEFETVALAQVEAEKYGGYVGQLPKCLRTDVDEIWIHKGVQPFGGGNNSILIHTGQSALYERDGILEETLVHEATHTSLDARHAADPGWLAAQQLDGGFISDYAEEFPDREDVAESFLLWLAVRHRKNRISMQDYEKITQAIPNRLAYFDGITCDLHPIPPANTTPASEVKDKNQRLVVYPNPTTGDLYLQLEEEKGYQIVIYNSIGHVVQRRTVTARQKIDLSDLTDGAYFVVVQRDRERRWEKIIKLSN